MLQNQKLNSTEIGCSGFCRRCGREHWLPEGAAHQACLELMAQLEMERRIDLQLPLEQADDRFSVDYLFGPARGKMFGVMIAIDRDGRTVTSRAFSGQYNGAWEVLGWVEPVFKIEAFRRVHDDEERAIKALGREIAEQDPGSTERTILTAARKEKSRHLMKQIHNLYRLKNFQGQEASLQNIFPQGRGIPTGTGDCCAPKLLQYAATHDLAPIGMAEFYWGRASASGTRQHGRFYPSCKAKCTPVLGFMLCGLKAEP